MTRLLQLQDPQGRPWQPTFKRRQLIRVHRIHAEAEYDPLQQGNVGFTRFLAEQRRRYGMEFDETQDNNDPPKDTTIMTLVSIRRKSLLAIFLVTLVELSRVDICFMLPVGLIVYSVALQVAWEQWTIEQEQEQAYRRHLIKIKKDLEEARERIDFENHIIKDKWNIDLVPQFREVESQWVLWSVPKCPIRKHAAVH
jgi:hypothetical protein